jgi:hypothetical protein
MRWETVDMQALMLHKLICQMTWSNLIQIENFNLDEQMIVLSPHDVWPIYFVYYPGNT